MAVTPVPIVANFRLLKWNGSNGAEIAEFLNGTLINANPNFTLVSETPDRLTLNGNGGYGPRDYSVDAGGGYVLQGYGLAGEYDAATLAEYYREVPS